MANQLCLVHHGIKGMKWGVRRFQNKDGSLTAAGHQRYLNQLDAQMRSNVSGAYNARVTRQEYERRAKLAESKGKAEKAEKYRQRAKNAAKWEAEEIAEYQKTGDEYIKALWDLTNSGYAFKATPANHLSIRTTTAGKKYMEQNGNFSRYLVSNDASGNIFTVREHVSAKKSEKWKQSSAIQRHSPQQTTYVYV